MLLDNPTLLLALMLDSTLMAAGLAAVARGSGHRELLPWVTALLLQALAWLAIFGRNLMPAGVSVVSANLLMAGSLAAMLAALSIYRGRSWPRAACLLPPAAAAGVCWLQMEDFAGRVVGTSVIYGVQLALLAWSVAVPAEMRRGRARGLLLAVTSAALLVVAFRLAAAALGAPFASSLAGEPLHPAQLMVFGVALATSSVGSLGFVLMIMERTDREIRELAMTDSLTQVCNRRSFVEQGEQVHAASLRSRSPMALMMIDVDHFKSINDQYGHGTGDQVLVEIARLLSGRVRRQDTVGRYGGEEFSVVAPNTDEAGARTLAEALRCAVESTPLTGRGLRATISVGLSVCPGGCGGCPPDFAGLLEQADEALYQAKRSGRNRIVVAIPADPVRTAA